MEKYFMKFLRKQKIVMENSDVYAGEDLPLSMMQEMPSLILKLPLGVLKISILGGTLWTDFYNLTD